MDVACETKYCGKCKQTLPQSLFAKNSAKKDGLQERCTPCRRAHHDERKHLRKKPTPEQKRKHLLRGKYKLSMLEFDLMLEAQGNVCAICGTSEWGRPSPSVDHCHATMKVRGLLCNTCNRGLGLFKDDIRTLISAIEYLQAARIKHKSEAA